MCATESAKNKSGSQAFSSKWWARLKIFLFGSLDIFFLSLSFYFGTVSLSWAQGFIVFRCVSPPLVPLLSKSHSHWRRTVPVFWNEIGCHSILFLSSLLFIINESAIVGRVPRPITRLHRTIPQLNKVPITHDGYAITGNSSTTAYEINIKKWIIFSYFIQRRHLFTCPCHAIRVDFELSHMLDRALISDCPFCIHHQNRLQIVTINETK